MERPGASRQPTRSADLGLGLDLASDIETDLVGGGVELFTIGVTEDQDVDIADRSDQVLLALGIIQNVGEQLRLLARPEDRQELW